MTQQDAYMLFNDALQVINKSLQNNKDKFPYGEIINLGDKIIGDRQIGVAVYKDDPSSPYDFFTVKMKNGKLELFSHGKEEPTITWKVSREYLQKVGENEQEYIDHPEKLDLEWLKDRLSIGK